MSSPSPVTSSDGGVASFSPAQKDLKRGAVRGGAITAGSQVAKFVIQTLGTVILARLLTAEDYGKIAMVSALLGFVTLFRDLGLSTATIQREKITHDQISGLFWINVATGFVLMLIMAAVSPLIAWFYGKPELLYISLAFALLAPINGFGAQHGALLQRQMRFKSLAIRDVLAMLAGLAAGIIAAKAGLHYWALVIQQAVNSVVSVASLWWQSGWRPSSPRKVQGLSSMVKFGGKLTLSNVLGHLSGNIDSIVLGHAFGDAAVGVYNRAQMLLAKPLRQFLPPIVSVATPTFSRLRQDQERFARNAVELLSFVAMGSCLMVGFLMPTADWVVRVMLGEKWGDAVLIFQMLALFAFIEPCASVLGVLMVVSGRPGQLAKYKVFSSILIIIGLAAGLPWGPVGAATTFAVSGLVIRAPLFLWYAARSCNIQLSRFYRAIGPFFLAGTAVAVLGLLARRMWSPENPFVGMAAYWSLGTLTYLGMILLTATGRQRIAQARDLLKLLKKQAPVAASPKLSVSGTSAS